MIRILFVCHGNICRSPMAEFIARDAAEKAGLVDAVEFASAATSAEEIGNPVYPPAARELNKHGISCRGKTARRIARGDYDMYDYIICMEAYNVRNALRVLGGDPNHKVRLLLDFTDAPGDIADPWYSGDFALAYGQIERGVKGLLHHLREELEQCRN